MRPKSSLSRQTYPSNQHSKTLLTLFIGLCVPIIILFALYPWFCQTRLPYMDIWIFFLFGCWLIYQFFFRSNEEIILIKTYLDGFIVLIPCLFIFLCLPLPAHALRLLSSRLFMDTKWIATQAYWIFDPGYGWCYMSYWPQQTRQFAMHGIASVFIFFLIIHTIKTRFQLNILLYSIFGSLIVGTLAGCLFFYDWSETKSFLSVNHHMALILHMLIPLCLGVLMSFYKKTRKPVFKTFSYSLKVSLTNLLWGEQAILTKIAFIFFLLFGFLLFARPFGLKMFGLSIALILGGTLITGKPKLRSLFFVWCVVGLFIGIYALTSNSVSITDPINQLLINIFKDSPITGIGPGALSMVWSKYSDIVPDNQLLHASAWVKFLAEYGLLGMGFTLCAIAAFIIRMNNMWHKRQRLYNVGWGLGILMALIATGIFGMGYNLGNPYIIMPVVSSLAACGFLVLHAGHSDSRQDFFYRNVVIKRKSLFSLFSTLFILILLFIGTFQLYLSSCINNEDSDLFEAQTESDMIQAIKKNPFNANLWYHMAQWYQHKDADAVNYLKTYLPRADICYEISSYLAPKNNRIVFDAAQYWVWRSNILGDEHPAHLNNNGVPGTREQAILLFQEKFRTILNRQPDKLKPVVDAIWQWFKDDAIVLDAIPEKPKHLKQTALEYVLLQKNN
jgi:hypothetical protein